mgnify:CR=1 FL=1
MAKTVSMRPAKDEPSQDWSNEFVNSIKPFLLKGDYRTGLALAKAGLKKYPRSFVARFQYAKLLGDWADELPKARKQKLKSEAIAQ